ncbi:MAG: nodulation protein NodH [Pseudomonadota bacterium]
MAGFTSFVILAEMRTGSNFLESNLNALAGVSSLGELFNPHFVGAPNNETVLGFDLSAREAAPEALLEAIAAQSDLVGFRFFHDHDARVFDLVMADPTCAKIVLTRNPIDSYVSLGIVRQTDQWKMTNVKNSRRAHAVFDLKSFTEHVLVQKDQQLKILKSLQHSGQTAFYLDYEDLSDLEMLNGLAAFLGVAARLEGLDQTLKKQNPEPLSEKVENYDEMVEALSGGDVFDLNRTPNFEPRRAAAVPSYLAAPKSPLLFAPIPGARNDSVELWLADLDGEDSGALKGSFTQKTLRAWKKLQVHHRSFCLLAHPLERAHDVFCDKILSGEFGKIRQILIGTHGLVLPKTGSLEGYGLADHAQNFERFLLFLKRNLGGQTALRVDAHWASQVSVVQGFAQFAPLDLICRPATLAGDCAYLSSVLGLENIPIRPVPPLPQPFSLEEIYNAKLESVVRAAYPRDYATFGFSDWVPQI